MATRVAPTDNPASGGGLGTGGAMQSSGGQGNGTGQGATGGGSNPSSGGMSQGGSSGSAGLSGDDPYAIQSLRAYSGWRPLAAQSQTSAR